MPGIIMLGTMPIFYKIPVTDDLMYNVHHGTYPPQPTHVTIYYPPIPRPHCQCYEGMKPLDNRHKILQCYEAFKNIVGIWECPTWPGSCSLKSSLQCAPFDGCMCIKGYSCINNDMILFSSRHITAYRILAEYSFSHSNCPLSVLNCIPV